MTETIVFEMTQEDDDGFVAECLSEDIFTQADNWEELKINIIEAQLNFAILFNCQSEASYLLILIVIF